MRWRCGAFPHSRTAFATRNRLCTVVTMSLADSITYLIAGILVPGLGTGVLWKLLPWGSIDAPTALRGGQSLPRRGLPASGGHRRRRPEARGMAPRAGA